MKYILDKNFLINYRNNLITCFGDNSDVVNAINVVIEQCKEVDPSEEASNLRIFRYLHTIEGLVDVDLVEKSYKQAIKDIL